VVEANYHSKEKWQKTAYQGEVRRDNTGKTPVKEQAHSEATDRLNERQKEGVIPKQQTNLRSSKGKHSF